MRKYKQEQKTDLQRKKKHSKTESVGTNNIKKHQ